MSDLVPALDATERRRRRLSYDAIQDTAAAIGIALAKDGKSALSKIRAELLGD